MKEHEQSGVRQARRRLSLAQRVLQVSWWAAAVTLTAGIYVALDRAAWVEDLAEGTQGGLHLVGGAAVIALAGLLDPWGTREERGD